MNTFVLIYLMRLIEPIFFGKVAMIVVVFNFLKIFRDFSFDSALIQKHENEWQSLSSIFYFQTLTSILLSLVALGNVDNIEIFFKEEMLKPIITILSIDFILGAFTSIPRSLIRKKLLFKKLFFVNFLSFIASSFIAIYLALFGFQIESILAKLIVNNFITGVVLFFVVGWTPRFYFNINSFKDYFTFSLPLVGNQLLNFLVRNIDDLSIGKFINSNSLGIYNRAYQVVSIPISNITNVFSNVLFPTWTSYNQDVNKIRGSYLETKKAIALISFPAMTIILVTAPLFINLLLGNKWEKMVTTFQILGLIGMLQAITSLHSLIFIVFDRNKNLLKINFYNGIIVTISIVLCTAIFKNIEITAITYGLSSSVALIPTYRMLSDILNCSISDLLIPILKPLLISILLAIFTWILCFHLFVNLSDLTNFVITTITSLLLALILISVFEKKAFKFFLSMITNDSAE